MPFATDVIDRPIEKVWAMVSDFAGLMRWHPQLRDCVVKGAGIGSERRVTLPDRTAVERLDVLDHDRHVLQYTVTETADPRVLGVSGRIELAAEDGGGTRVTWTFGLPDEHPEAEAVNGRMAAYYPVRINNLREAVERDSSPS